MTSLEKHALYTVLLRLTDDNQVLTPLERRDIMNQIVHAACGITADDILASTQNNRKLLLKRGTTTKNDTYMGLDGELTYDIDSHTLRIHDGVTIGGHLVSGGSTIISVNMPDYSAAETKSWDTVYKADCNSLIVYKTNHTSGDPSVEVYISVDGINFTSLKASNAGGGSLMLCGEFLVPKDYYWKIIGGRNIDRTLTMYPIVASSTEP